MFYSVINIKIVQLHCEKYCQLCNFALPKKVSGEMNSVCVFVPFWQMWSTLWAQWPEVTWARQRPMTSPLAIRTPSGWWRSMAWAAWWVQNMSPHSHPPAGGGGGESDAGERNKLYAFVVFIQRCLSLPSQKQWEFHALGKKVEEQKDRHFLECFFFHFRRFWKRLNLLHLNKSHREHSKMVMFHVCQTKAFYVTYFHSWLKASVWFYLFICSSE